jgi:hypothetical protein
MTSSQEAEVGWCLRLQDLAPGQRAIGIKSKMPPPFMDPFRSAPESKMAGAGIFAFVGHPVTPGSSPGHPILEKCKARAYWRLCVFGKRRGEKGDLFGRKSKKLVIE